MPRNVNGTGGHDQASCSGRRHVLPVWVFIQLLSQLDFAGLSRIDASVSSCLKTECLQKDIETVPNMFFHVLVVLSLVCSSSGDDVCLKVSLLKGRSR